MLELLLSLNQNTLSPGESIGGTIQLRNAGAEPLVVNARLALNAPFSPPQLREVSLTINAPSGDPLDFLARVNVGAPRDNHFKLLQPGESVEHTYALDNYYNLEQPGTYSVQAVYQNQAEPSQMDGHTVWKGELASKRVTFTVQA